MSRLGSWSRAQLLCSPSPKNLTLTVSRFWKTSPGSGRHENRQFVS